MLYARVFCLSYFVLLWIKKKCKKLQGNLYVVFLYTD